MDVESTIRDLTTRVGMLETIIRGNSNIQLVGLMDKINVMSADINRLEAELTSLNNWRQQMLNYVKLAIAISAIGSIGSMNEIFRMIMLVLGGL